AHGVLFAGAKGDERGSVRGAEVRVRGMANSDDSAGDERLDLHLSSLESTRKVQSSAWQKELHIPPVLPPGVS
ncbi:MAG: hypothetical protein WA869_21425, partial [Alloacidobacterium sp.]